MTRTCEKFVEELTSGNRQFSTELREHLAGCPECQQAAASLNLLAANRKPLSGSEAASIAAVLKMVNADAAVSSAAAGSTATNTASLTLRYVLLATLGIAIITSILVNSSIDQQRKAMQPPPPLRQIQPAMPSASGAIQPEAVLPEDSLLPPIEYDESAVPLINHDATDPASETANPGTIAEEVNASPATEIKMVSPDEEEITP